MIALKIRDCVVFCRIIALKLLRTDIVEWLITSIIRFLDVFCRIITFKFSRGTDFFRMIANKIDYRCPALCLTVNKYDIRFVPFCPIAFRSAFQACLSFCTSDGIPACPAPVYKPVPTENTCSSLENIYLEQYHTFFTIFSTVHCKYPPPPWLCNLCNARCK